MIKDGRAEVIEDKCVLCGHCLHVCPQSAKTMASDLDTVKYYIRQGHRVVASLAPAYMGFLQEGTIGQIHEAVRKLGCFDVRETAEGAAAVTGEYAKLLEDGKKMCIRDSLLDTPGYFDFVGEVEEAVSVADAAIIVVNCKAGIEVGTEKAWELCEEYNLPRIIFVTNMDDDQASFRELILKLEKRFGRKIAPFQVPIQMCIRDRLNCNSLTWGKQMED